MFVKKTIYLNKVILKFYLEIGVFYSLGEIRFEKVTSRYPVRGDVTLREISVMINPGEKIAVVGRTGSGKTSLVLSLFRFLETVEGMILVDGEDIAKRNLCCHRNSITIIPQVFYC
jgi:ATP-binding cassette subfamily C (CFTR/MRP) protein 1